MGGSIQLRNCQIKHSKTVITDFSHFLPELALETCLLNQAQQVGAFSGIVQAFLLSCLFIKTGVATIAQVPSRHLYFCYITSIFFLDLERWSSREKPQGASGFQGELQLKQKQTPRIQKGKTKLKRTTTPPFMINQFYLFCLQYGAI